MELSQEGIEQSETFKKSIDRIIDNPMSEEEYIQQSKSGISAGKGIVTFSEKKAFSQALRYAQTRCPWLSDDFVEETLKHEEEHLDEARKRFGDRGTYKYKLQAIQMTNGNLGISGGFEIVVDRMSQTEMNEKHAKYILGAPKKLSATDKINSGIDPNADIVNDNDW